MNKIKQEQALKESLLPFQWEWAKGQIEKFTLMCVAIPYGMIKAEAIKQIDPQLN